MKQPLSDNTLDNARRYPNRLSGDRRKYLFTKPFGNAIKGDDLTGKFHDFAHILEFLEDLPGGRILDIGCGPGWLTEFLCRMGYSVTGVDVSPGMIRIARKRLRKIPFRRRISSLPCRFFVMDAHELPFHNMFDAVVLYDTLHHFEREDDVLRSAYRSLVPGGRIFLKEPPETHPESPGAQSEMREFGVLEKGYTRDALFDLLHSAGFEVIRFHFSAAFLVPEDKVFGPYLEAVVQASHREHMVTAAKPPVIPDSRNPSVLAARYHLLQPTPHTLKKGESFLAVIEVENTGDTIWIAEPRRTGGHVRMAVVLEHPPGTVLREQFAGAPLESDVFPGHRSVFKLHLTAPQKIGDYIFRFNLLAELLKWFDTHLSIRIRVV